MHQGSGGAAPAAERQTDTAKHADWRDGQREAAAKEAPAETPAADAEPDESVAHRKMLADGIFASPEDLARAFALSPEEIEALGKPLPEPPSRRSIDAELAAIDRTRRADRRSYNKSDMPARELELLELRAKLPAKTDDAGKDADPASLGIAPELLAQWEKKQGGIEPALKTVRATASAVLDELGPEDREALQTGFDGLPDAARTAVYDFLSVKGGNFRPADDAALQEFGTTEEGGELVAEWGRHAGLKLATARGKIGLVLGAMPASDRAATEAWFDALPASQAKAILRTLAG